MHDQGRFTSGVGKTSSGCSELRFLRLPKEQSDSLDGKARWVGKIVRILFLALLLPFLAISCPLQFNNAMKINN